MEKTNRNLYRFEYYEPLDECKYVDWVWLEPHEVSEYNSGNNTTKFRAATSEEEELYNEAYSDGYGMAAALEFESNYNGVTFRVELDKITKDFSYTKMFQCATCKNHKDFETEVAMANGFYLTELRGEKNDVLWHVCYECAMLKLEVDGIELDITEEGETNS